MKNNKNIIIADLETTNSEYAKKLNKTEIKTIQFSNLINWRSKSSVDFVKNFKTNIIVNEGNIDKLVDVKHNLNIIETNNLFITFLDYIVDNFGECYVFFVNGRNFDIEFLMSQASMHLDIISKENIRSNVNNLKQFFELAITYKGILISFRDTLNLFGPHRLLNLLTSFEKDPVWPLISSMVDVKNTINHEVWNTNNLILTEQLKMYCKGDVLIPALYFWNDAQAEKGLKVLDKEFKLFPLSILQQRKLSLTASSFAMKIFEKLYNKVYGKTTKQVKDGKTLYLNDNKVFERTFIGYPIMGVECVCNKPVIKCSKCNFVYYIIPEKPYNDIYNDDYELTNDDVRNFCYVGGLTLNNPLYKNELRIKGKDITENIWIDRVSMYPSVISTYRFPKGAPMKERTHSSNITYNIILIIKLVLRPNKLPIIPTKNIKIVGLCNDTAHKYIENYEGEAFRFDYISDEYLDLLKETYEMTYETIKTFYFETTNKQQPIMKALYQVKDQAKKDGFITKANSAKLVINGFYGKMGQKHLTNNPIWDYDEHTFLGETDSEMGTFNIVFAAATTTFARIDLLKAIYALGYENFEYCDTDSIHTRNLSIETIKSKLPIGKAMGEWEDQSTFTITLDERDENNRSIKVDYDLIGSKHIKAKCYVKIGYNKKYNNYTTSYVVAGVNKIDLQLTFNTLEEAYEVVDKQFNIGKAIGKSSGTMRIPGGKVICPDETSTVITDSNNWCNHIEKPLLSVSVDNVGYKWIDNMIQLFIEGGSQYEYI